MSIISIQSLSKRYGNRIGIDGIDLQVREGAIYGFLGPNGAGKTTAIRVLLGFMKPTSGRAEIFGLDCWSSSHRIKRDVGYLPGDVRLYAWMTARTALQIVGQVRRTDLSKAGHELAERFRLDMDVSVRRMSKGMRQKLGLILVMAHKPRLLVLDEPTSGLDPLMQIELGEYLRTLANDGHTVFFSSHTLSEVDQLCDRIAIIRDGCIVADESLETLRGRAHRQVTVAFESPGAAESRQPPPCLKVLRRTGDRWIAEMDGDAAALIHWSAANDVMDLSIGQPDLETLFRRFYQEPGGSA